jgi:hypothetical protein
VFRSWSDLDFPRGVEGFVTTPDTQGGRGEQLAAGSAEALAARKAEEAMMQRLRREEENLILRKAAAVFAQGIV